MRVESRVSETEMIQNQGPKAIFMISMDTFCNKGQDSIEGQSDADLSGIANLLPKIPETHAHTPSANCRSLHCRVIKEVTAI
jgi:hypothetical protein